MEKDKDLGLKIGTPEEANWKSILQQSEELVVKGKADLKINEMIVKLAKRKFDNEQRKMKSPTT